MKAIVLRLLFLSMWLMPLVASAQPAGMLTLLEGSARLLRGASVYAATEGIRLQDGDILVSGSNSLVQIDLADGAIAVLGPQSEAMIAAAPRTDSGAELLLRSGWLKGEPRRSGAGDSRYLTMLLGVATLDGTLVMRASPEGTEAFVESGTAKHGELGTQGTFAGTRPAKGGEFLYRATGKQTEQGGRVPAPFVAAMPPAFRDTLPARSARFKDREKVPRLETDASYADVEFWLKAPKAWRKGMVKRFRPRLKDPAFRAAVDANMKFHPEWDPILHPERYLPKKPDEPAGRRP